MSSLWTPDGERPIPRPSPTTPSQERTGPTARHDQPSAPAPGRGDAGQSPHGAGIQDGSEDVDDVAMAAELDDVRRAILSSPPEAVIANHCYGLFELAAMHLSQQPPSLEAARLAIDGLAALTEGLSGRLGPDEETLREGLAQLRLAWVQVGAAHSAAGAAGDARPGESC